MEGEKLRDGVRMPLVGEGTLELYGEKCDFEHLEVVELHSSSKLLSSMSSSYDDFNFNVFCISRSDLISRFKCGSIPSSILI